MKTATIAISSLAAGAGLVYLLDPAAGPRRRSRLRDKARHFALTVDRGTRHAARDLVNRERGLVADARSLFTSRRVPDDVLERRVRSALGHLTSHAGAIEATCHDGRVVLSGDVLDDDHDHVVSGIGRVAGVRGLDDRLVSHHDADGIAALQGGAITFRARAPIAESAWPSGARLALGIAGGGLLVTAALGRGLARVVPALVGGAMVLRGVTNVELGRALGVGRPGVIDIEKSIRIAAPIEQVFALFSKPETFPRFMRHVRSVDRVGDGRWRWTVEGPAGVPVVFDAELADLAPNERIAWRTLDPSVVESEGVVHFERMSPAMTRVHVRMSYAPPAGVVGHAIAALFAVDPKHALDDDLQRMTSLLEEGRATGHEGKVTVDDVTAPPNPSPTMA